MLAVTLRQLQVFKAVVDGGSFSAAAAALAISQPSISAHVTALERRVRQPLFDRQRGRVPTLTETGRKVYDYAETTIRQSTSASADILALRAARDLVLSVASQRYIANNLLPRALADFARDNPGIEIIANIGMMEHALERLRRGEVDLALFLARGEIPGIRSEVIGTQRLAFVAAPDHPLARRRRVRARELRAWPFSGPLKDSMYGRLLHAVMAEIGITDFAMITQSQDPRVWRELLCAGIGISCLLHLSAVPDIEAGRLVEIPVVEDTPAIEVRIGFSPVRAISPASQAFVEFVRRRRFSDAAT
jgi:DNA-binding transcriptional LysR family regulator